MGSPKAEKRRLSDAELLAGAQDPKRPNLNLWSWNHSVPLTFSEQAPQFGVCSVPQPPILEVLTDGELWNGLRDVDNSTLRQDLPQSAFDWCLQSGPNDSTNENITEHAVAYSDHQHLGSNDYMFQPELLHVPTQLSNILPSMPPSEHSNEVSFIIPDLFRDESYTPNDSSLASPAAFAEQQPTALPFEPTHVSPEVLAQDQNSNQCCAQSLSHADPPEPEVCFGVLEEEVQVSSTLETANKERLPLRVEPLGDALMLYCQNSGEKAGLCMSPGLCKILKECSVRLESMLVSKRQQGSQTKGKTSGMQESCFHMRVLVYGHKSERTIVADCLSDNDLFLQHPSASEIDQSVEYDNPHFLVRPGGQMPDLAELTLSEGQKEEKAGAELDEIEKSQILRIFDTEADICDPMGDICQSSRLRTVLKDHQLTALGFMVEKESRVTVKPNFHSLWEAAISESTGESEFCHIITGRRQKSPPAPKGGILADEMGLGKTLSLLALVCHSLDSYRGSSTPRKTLVVTPKSTIPGWISQVQRHVHGDQLRCYSFHATSRQDTSSEFENADMVITTYETLRSEWDMQGPLHKQKWLRIILDEAHHIRNTASKTFKAVSTLHATYRWCATGTPIHNKIDDFGALLAFIRTPDLIKKTDFQQRIASPLKANAAVGLGRLGSLVKATCLRRNKRSIEESCPLPNKKEVIKYVTLSSEDQQVYDFFKGLITEKLQGQKPSTQVLVGSTQKFESNLLSLIGVLRFICDHGQQLLSTPSRLAWEQRDKQFSGWMTINNGTDNEQERVDLADSPDENHIQDDDRSNSITPGSSRDFVQDQVRSKSPSFAPTDPASLMDYELQIRDQDIPTPKVASAKVKALLANLREEQRLGSHEVCKTTKSVIFSCWTKMLDLIQQALDRHEFRFQRIDGSTSLAHRGKAMKQFNEDPMCTIMLASIGSAGEGVDLTAASHVHLIEPQWNPMVEAQAVDRVHRIGQTREVVITRYIVENSIEKYIQTIQEEKTRLIHTSLDQEEESRNDLLARRLRTLKSILEC